MELSGWRTGGPDGLGGDLVPHDRRTVRRVPDEYTRDAETCHGMRKNLSDGLPLRVSRWVNGGRQPPGELTASHLRRRGESECMSTGEVARSKFQIGDVPSRNEVRLRTSPIWRLDRPTIRLVSGGLRTQSISMRSRSSETTVEFPFDFGKLRLSLVAGAAECVRSLIGPRCMRRFATLALPRPGPTGICRPKLVECQSCQMWQT